MISLIVIATCACGWPFVKQHEAVVTYLNVYGFCYCDITTDYFSFKIVKCTCSEWKDGLLPRILRRHAQQLKTSELFSGVKPAPFAKWIHLDGIVSHMLTMFCLCSGGACKILLSDWRIQRSSRNTGGSILLFRIEKML
jgi:hypothetical protein